MGNDSLSDSAVSVRNERAEMIPISQHALALEECTSFPFAESGGLDPQLPPPPTGYVALGLPTQKQELRVLPPSCPGRANVTDEEIPGKWKCWPWGNAFWPRGQADLGSFPFLP